MPATRAAAQRAEAQRVALLAAASNADTQPLSHELVDIVIKQLPRSQLASARLVSKQFAAAVDPLISAVAIRLKSWDKRATPLLGLQHVTRLDVGSDVKGSDQCRQLQHITNQLPKLNTLRFLHPALDFFTVTFATSLSSLSSLTRLDMTSVWGPPGTRRYCFPRGVQLPGLMAASFDFSCNLADIAALAPNLEQLYCFSLWILDSSAALPTCTHLGGYEVRITSKTEPAQAFAAGFPNVQVVTYMPVAVRTADGQSTLLSAQQLLAQSASVRAVRGWSRQVMQDATAAGSHTLDQLQRLRLHGMKSLNIATISSMTQLQHLRITWSVDNTDDAKPQALLRALVALPQLQSLVLPAGVLCSRCCPGVQSSLQGLAAKSSLKQLVFLEWQHQHGEGFETVFRCTHPEAIQNELQSAAAAATAAAASTQEQQQQQRQQLTTLHQQQHQEAMPRPVEANPDSAAGVWGVYGPPGEW